MLRIGSTIFLVAASTLSMQGCSGKTFTVKNTVSNENLKVKFDERSKTVRIDTDHKIRFVVNLPPSSTVTQEKVKEVCTKFNFKGADKSNNELWLEAWAEKKSDTATAKCEEISAKATANGDELKIQQKSDGLIQIELIHGGIPVVQASAIRTTSPGFCITAFKSDEQFQAQMVTANRDIYDELLKELTGSSGSSSSKSPEKPSGDSKKEQQGSLRTDA